MTTLFQPCCLHISLAANFLSMLQCILLNVIIDSQYPILSNQFLSSNLVIETSADLRDFCWCI